MKMRSVLLRSTTLFLGTTVRALSTTKSYDLLVVGGGSAGLTAAKFASTFGKSVAIIEASKLGGDCTWNGCVPSKTLIKSAKVAHTVVKAKEFGVNVDCMNVDMKAIRDRIRATREYIYEEDDSPKVIKQKFNIDTIEGFATFISPKLLRVTTAGTLNEEQQVEAKYGVVLCTGASAVKPGIPGLDKVNYLTYETIFDTLDYVPKTMTIVGSGPIGCELAQAFSRLGSKVTIVSKSPLLPNADCSISDEIYKVFVSEGIDIVQGTVSMVESSNRDVDNAEWNHSVHVTSSSSPSDLVFVKGEVLVLAIGRKPNSRNMGLEDLGVEINQRTGGFAVDSQLQTTVRNIYAAGDCTGLEQFTHYAGFQGAIAARNILLPFSDPGVVMSSSVPSTIFTDPEVSSVGMTEKQAVEEYGSENILVKSQPVGHIDRAVCEGTNKFGFIKVILKKRNNQILGVSIIGPNAGELVSEMNVAMKAGMKFDTLATVIHSYPTYSIALQVMAADLYYEKLTKLKPILDVLKRFGL